MLFQNIDDLNDTYSETENNINCKYFSSESFNEDFNSLCSSDFSIVHCNIRSLNANGEDYIHYLDSLKHRFDAICFSETWCKDTEVLNNFFPTYHGFHCIRPESKKGGGVSIFVKKRFQTKLISQLNENSEIIESLFLKLCVGRKVVKIGCIYRAPSINHDAFMANFESIIHP